MKRYAVLLFEDAYNELEPLLGPMMKRDELGAYFYSSKVDPNGPYFHMTLSFQDDDVGGGEFELQIPHRFVKAVFYSADLKKIGFTA